MFPCYRLPFPPVPSSGTLHGIVFSSAGGADQLQGFGKADQIVQQMELFQGHLSAGCCPLEMTTRYYEFAIENGFVKVDLPIPNRDFP